MAEMTGVTRPALALMLALALAACAAPSLAQQPQATPSLAADPAISERTLTWAKVDGLELSANIYRSRTARGALPVLIDVHGGAWSSGDRNVGRHYGLELAKTGVLVVSVDFRQAPAFRHPAASADVTAAIRWVRLNARALDADPDRIGLIGSSSGGHLAMLAVVRADAPQHRGTPIAGPDGAFVAHDEVSTAVDYVVAMWPVSDPAYRYRYARRAGLDRLAAATESYYGGEAAMWDASIPRIVTSGEADALPPLLLVQPGEDSNIPQEMTFDLMRAWQARGGKVDYAFFPGEAHAFGLRPSPATTDLIAVIGAFVSRRNAE
jgi:acetyl esterase/lipase